MEKENLTYDEKLVGNFLKNELFKISEENKEEIKQESFNNIEYISKQEEEISPILKMNEDQILDFVETFDVSQLSTLSVRELNYIGEKLGVEPKILFGLSD